jgi:hypothetical protein
METKKTATEVYLDSTLKEVITKALKNEIQNGDNKGSSKYTLEYGSKKVTIDIEVHTQHPQEYWAHTFVETIPNAPRLSGETELLYRAVSKILQTEAQNSGMPIKYELLTCFRKMKLWANTTGANIFHWKRTPDLPVSKYQIADHIKAGIPEEEIEDTYMCFEKIFLPPNDSVTKR